MYYIACLCTVVSLLLTVVFGTKVYFLVREEKGLYTLIESQTQCILCAVLFGVFTILSLYLKGGCLINESYL